MGGGGRGEAPCMDTYGHVVRADPDRTADTAQRTLVFVLVCSDKGRGGGGGGWGGGGGLETSGV